MSLWKKIAALFRKEKLDAEMSEEMRAHLERRTEANLLAGMSADEAHYAAQRQFGGVEQLKEIAREQRGVVWLEQTGQDLRYAVRQLSGAKGFTSAVVLTLALGIGATTAIFSVVNTVIFNPIAGADSKRLVQIGQREGGVGRESGRDYFAGVTPPVLTAITANRAVFDGLAWYETFSLERKTEDFVVKEPGVFVSLDFFSVIGAKPILGRTFAAGEVTPLDDSALPTRDTAIVVSYAWWQSAFAGDPQVLGRTVELGGRRHTVVGVMPEHFQFPSPQTRFWLPTEPIVPRAGAVRFPATQVIARIANGTTIEQGRAMLGTITQRLMADYPAGAGYGQAWRRTPKGLTLEVRSLSTGLQDLPGGVELRRTLFGLLAAVGFVLLIVCANVANLTLARVERRQHELAIRAALGAGRGRLVRQLLMENILLAVTGGAAGLILAAWGINVLATLSSLPRLRPIEMDGAVLGLGLAVSLFTGLVFGLAPMWRAGRVRVKEALVENGANSAGGRRGNGYRGTLVIVQVAVTMVLLAGAGLMLRSVLELLRVKPGFDPEKLLWVDVPLPPRKYEVRDPARSTSLKNGLFVQIQERLAALPGVKAVGFLQSYGANGFTVEGRPESVAADFTGCGIEKNDAFQAMGIPLVAGRLLTASDVDQKSMVVVNESMAALFWPGENAVGKKFHGGGPKEEPKYEVVGVVGDAKVKGYAEVVPPTYYRPAQEGSGMIFIGGPAPRFIVRAGVDPRTLIAAVRRELKELEPELQTPVFSVAEHVLYDSTRAQRTYRNYLMIFAGVGLLLSALGTYGVLAYAVACRTREIGIRIAIGADYRAVLGLVMGQGAKLIGTGIALGLVMAFWLTRFIRSQLFNVNPNDPLVLVGVVSVLAAVALVACWLPARRATKVDPLIALRAE